MLLPLVNRSTGGGGGISPQPELQALIPVMTSNTTPSGVVSTSSNYDSNYVGWRAFDQNVTTAWASSSSATVSTSWIQYKFVQSVLVRKIKLTVNYSGTGPKYGVGKFSLYGSDDGSTWYVLLEDATVNESTTEITPEGKASFEVNINNNKYYLYYRLTNFTADLYSNLVQIQECQLYGEELGKTKLFTTTRGVTKTEYIDTVEKDCTATIIAEATFSSSNIGGNVYASDYLMIGTTKYILRNYMTSGGGWQTSSRFLFSSINVNAGETMVVNITLPSDLASANQNWTWFVVYS